MAKTSFPLRHRLLRLAWGVTWGLLGAWTPPPLHRWRRMLLNAFGANIAPGARVYGSATIWYPPNLTMKAGAVLGWKTYAYTQGPIVIGENAIVSQWTRLVTGTHDIHDPDFTLHTRPITIGDHAWVAAGCFVGPGVTVGEGAVLGGAGAAFKDLEPWTVYGGNPARPISHRSRLAASGAGPAVAPLTA